MRHLIIRVWRPRSLGLFFLVLALAGFSGVFSAYHYCGQGMFCSDPGDTIYVPPPPPPPTVLPTATKTAVGPQPCLENSENRCAAFAYLSGPQIDGAFAEFDVEPYTAPDWQTGGHSNQTVWLRDTATGDWCEVGWTLGTDGLFDSPEDSYTVYGAFSFGNHYYSYPISYPLGVFGTVHAFQIFRTQSTGEAQQYVDETTVGTCPVQVPTDEVQVGLEYTDERAVNNGVTPHDLQVRDYEGYDQTGSWQPWGAEIGTVDDCVVGNGAYLAWESLDQQFTDSSNVVSGGTKRC